jgi:hypothetical protein
MTNASGNGERKVTSLRDLPQAIQPPGDLWAGIEARIDAERAATRVDANAAARDGIRAGQPEGGSASRRRASFVRSPLPRWMAVAATISALAVGVWIGREVLPTKSIATQTAAQSGTHAGPQIVPANEGAKALQAAYMSDPKYRQERAALVKSLEAKLASLPPETRAKVISSLATIHKSMQDLEAALGKDPTNALLQELLLNTYQDEMRVLTTVQDASDAGRGV